MEELIDYASYHFAMEELWMGSNNYLPLDEHSAEHDKFRTAMIDFKRDYNQGTLNISLDILIFLKNWLTDHILKTDSEYGVFIKSKGAGL